MEEKIKQRLQEIENLRKMLDIQRDALDLEWDALCELQRKAVKGKEEVPEHGTLVFTL